MVLQRETAHRLFAEEYNASRATIEGQGEKDPSFLVSPTGAKINRLHVVGVCTDVEAVGESGEVWRARISDPTGVFTLYAGQYQPEAAQVLSDLKPPAYVAVTGKARTYTPEEGTVFVSIRPETVTVVDEQTRNQWLLDTARRSMERLKAVTIAGDTPSKDEMVQAGVRAAIADGVLLAHEHYGLQGASRYWSSVRTALEGLLPGGEVKVQSGQSDQPEVPQWKPEAAAAEPDAAQEAFDASVQELVQRLEGTQGARWDDILETAKAEIEGATAEDVEESLNRLMDKGLVYEPTLGVLKST
jgi:uncharacterized protein